MNQESYHVNFDQVAGLWVMLGIAASISVLLVLLHLWRHKWWPALRARPAVRRWLLCGGCGGVDGGGRGLPVRLLGIETMISKAGAALQSAAQPHASSSLAASRREFDRQSSAASKVSDDSSEPSRRLSTGVAAMAPRLASATRPAPTLSPAPSGAAYEALQLQLAALTVAVEQLAARLEAQQAAQEGPCMDHGGGAEADASVAQKPAGRMSSMQRLLLGRVMRRYKNHASAEG